MHLSYTYGFSVFFKGRPLLNFWFFGLEKQGNFFICLLYHCTFVAYALKWLRWSLGFIHMLNGCKLFPAILLMLTVSQQFLKSVTNIGHLQLSLWNNDIIYFKFKFHRQEKKGKWKQFCKLLPDLKRERKDENKLWKGSAQPRPKSSLNVKSHRLSLMLKLSRYYYLGLSLFSELSALNFYTV